MRERRPPTRAGTAELLINAQTGAAHHVSIATAASLFLSRRPAEGKPSHRVLTAPTGRCPFRISPREARTHPLAVWQEPPTPEVRHGPPDFLQRCLEAALTPATVDAARHSIRSEHARWRNPLILLAERRNCPLDRGPYVDDGRCPAGEVKKITRGNQKTGFARQVECVKRPRSATEPL